MPPATASAAAPNVAIARMPAPASPSYLLPRVVAAPMPVTLLAKPSFPRAHVQPIYEGKPAKLGCGGRQLYLSPRHGGECWRCPDGFARNDTALVTSSRACAKRNGLEVPKVIAGPFRRATLERTAWGCPIGQFLSTRHGGSCMACPSGYKPSLALGDAQDCRRIASDAKLVGDYAKRLADNLGAQLRVLGEIRSCLLGNGFRSKLIAAFDHHDAATAASIKNRCVSPAQIQTLLAAPRMAGRSTSSRAADNGKIVELNVTLTGGGMIPVVGLFGGKGWTWDLTGGHHPSTFWTGEYAFGAGLTAGADLAVGYAVDNWPSTGSRQHGTSVAFAGKFLAGGGISMDFARSTNMLDIVSHLSGVSDTADRLFDDFQGATVSAGPGAGAEIGTIHASVANY
jgi:hypothetical protein